MTLGIGCDIIEIDRIKSSIQRHGQRFLDKIFTCKEQVYCQKHRYPMPHFAARFALKEAIVKALGKGISQEVSWLDIEIDHDPAGKPIAILSEKVQIFFNFPELQISVSHCKEYAMAMAIWIK
jgi:holo-[acyl-carrier protein] synthase